VIFHQAWRFVAPGLYESEKRLALPFAAAASFFFVLGAGFCYVLVFPVGFRFFLDEYVSIGVAPQLRISEYLSFTSGCCSRSASRSSCRSSTFFLARLGVLTHRTSSLDGATRSSSIFIVAAVLTPGPDVALAAPHGGAAPRALRVSIGVAYFAAPRAPRGGRGRAGALDA
jgi:sec-independent protein translocase protein TatC